MSRLGLHHHRGAAHASRPDPRAGRAEPTGIRSARRRHRRPARSASPTPAPPPTPSPARTPTPPRLRRRRHADANAARRRRRRPVSDADTDTAPTPTPSPTNLPPSLIDNIRVGFFGINCGQGVPVPRNGERILPRGCRGYVTATPKEANGDDVPLAIHGPDIEWFVLEGADKIDVQAPTFRERLQQGRRRRVRRARSASARPSARSPAAWAGRSSPASARPATAPDRVR